MAARPWGWRDGGWWLREEEEEEEGGGLRLKALVGWWEGEGC